MHQRTATGLLLVCAIAAASGALLGPLGCSSSDNDGGPSTADAGPDGPVITPPTGPCDLSKDFGTPKLVPTGGGKSSGARLTDDELTIVYDDGAHIVIGTRSDTASAFQTRPWLAAANSSASSDFLPWISPTGRDLFFVSDRNGQGFDLFRARREDTGSAFGAATSVLPWASGNLLSPYLLEGRALWFTRQESGQESIFRAPLTGDATFGPASPVAELNDPASKNGAATLTTDGRTVYFGSTREGSGDQDIWMATRAADSDTFGTPTRVPGVNSAFNDSPGWISPNGCRLYLSSDRDEGNDGGTREAHTFVAERPK